MYMYSSLLGKIATLSSKLLERDAVRYRYFVDSSAKGTNCTYARITHRKACEEGEHALLREQLLSLQRMIEEALQQPLPPYKVPDE